MDKMRMIASLSQAIKDLSERDESTLHWKNGKIKFRLYDRLTMDKSYFSTTDITIERHDYEEK